MENNNEERNEEIIGNIGQEESNVVNEINNTPEDITNVNSIINNPTEDITNVNATFDNPTEENNTTNEQNNNSDNQQTNNTQNNEKAESSNNESFDQKVKDILNDVKDDSQEFSEQEKKDGKVLAILAYIIPLIPFLVEKNNKYVVYHAKQGMNLLIISIIASIVLSIISAMFPVIGGLLTFIIDLGIFALCVLGIIDVCNGRAKELPIINKMKIIK